MKITQEQYALILARRGETPQPAQSKAAKRESDIHGEIIQECRRRGWIYFHGSMAHATKRTTGEPDFVILADAGRVLLVEVKRPGGKLSTDQIAMQAHARKLGHTIHVVYSFEEFCQAVNNNTKGTK